MEREPMTNVVGLKALAYDLTTQTFVSPARPEFIWSPGGLQMSECSRCKNEPKEECSCGLYVTFSVDIALEYIHHSPISPIFLVEASGITHLYSDGYRSRELTVHLVAPNSDSAQSKLAASQAADYFQVNVGTLETILMVMDMHNLNLDIPFYRGRSETLNGFNKAALDVKMMVLQQGKLQ
jgi:hypothetical protein